MKDSVSIIIPAYNEEENIPLAISSVKKALKGISDYEIIVVNDGSIDSTEKVIRKLIKKNKRIKLINHSTNLGLGHNFRDGISLATKAYIGGFPGDNDMSAESLKSLILHRKKADLIISYMANPQARSLFRRIVSKAYVIVMNTLFNLRLKYFNGYFIAKSDLLKNLELKSAGFTIFVEIIVKLIKSGATYREIPFIHTGRKFGHSNAITLPNIKRSSFMILTLLHDIYFH